MRPSIRLALVFAGVLAVTGLFAPAAEAQWRHRARVRVFVGAHVGSPYFSPFHDPFFYRGFNGWGHHYWTGYGPQWPGTRVDEDVVVVRPEVSPDEAQLFVDGYFRGTVSDFDGRFEGLAIEPGEHEIVLYLQGYRTARRTVQLRGGTVYRLREKLVRLRAGEENEPPPTPTPRPDTASGPPERSEPMPGRPDRGQPARRIPPPAPGVPDAFREPSEVDARGFGSLAVRVQPAGAEVWIDGERWEGPADAGPLVVQLAAGRHRIEVRRDGYESFTTDVQVHEGDTVPLNVSLPARR